MNQVIWNGVGRIGDDLISGANETTVKKHFKHRKRNLWIKYGSVAACFCLAVCLCVPMIGMFRNISSDNAKEESEHGYVYIVHFTGCVIECDHGILNYVSYTEHSVSFILQKTDTERVNVNFTVRKQTDSNENSTSFIATTDRLYEGNNTLKDGLKITVNGVPTEEMPSSPGDYSITVDFSELAESGFVFDENFSITGFGRFAMQKYEIFGGTDISGLTTEEEKEYYEECDDILY